jgi:hypothetical protein
LEESKDANEDGDGYIYLQLVQHMPVNVTLDRDVQPYDLHGIQNTCKSLSLAGKKVQSAIFLTLAIAVAEAGHQETRFVVS